MMRGRAGKRQELVTFRARVYGIVQGVGFRPTVSRHAATTGVCGSVCNKGPYVEIYAQGTKRQTDTFLQLLEKQPPKRAAVLKIDVHPLGTEEIFERFEIIESEKTDGEIFISPDIAICEDCKKELFDPGNRRYLHPFINCTCCGPRLTILDALPYDRERTSMKVFPMCPDCAGEYHDPDSRRYDAQPVCCPSCGPEVYLIGRKERGRDAITAVRRILSQGGIAAVKGIGGFHLCCDATDEKAVERLRRLKNRPMKPFAVMLRDIRAVRRECETSPELEEILTGHQKPILLLKKKKGGMTAKGCAPDKSKLGVMLPYAPVQLLLFQYDDGISMPDGLVMTSANESGSPICRDDESAKQELAHLCDAMLSNDRDIRVRADDTVMDVFEGRPYMIRRSRGYAPLPVMVSEDAAAIQRKGCVLGIGGELKNSFTIGNGGLYYPSPYIGDLADIRTVEALKETIGRMRALLEVSPEIVACDLHPRYYSAEVAEEMGIPVVRVQHHYAHILSCMAENDDLRPVIGVAFDGTGYGTDGTVWGGEVLLADVHGFSRVASIMPFLQVGGDVSAKEGWRIAAAMLCEMAGNPQEAWEMAARLKLCGREPFQVQWQMAKRRLNAVESTSAGRLFDAVSAVLGIRRCSTFEGEASTALQYHAERYLERHPQKADAIAAREGQEPGIVFNGVQDRAEGEETGTEEGVRTERRMLLDTRALAEAILRERLDGADKDYLAYVFHRELAALVVSSCREIRRMTGRNTVALSGGVFQNTLFLGLCKTGLEAEGFCVLRHHFIPPNDGGISLGQALYAACQ